MSARHVQRLAARRRHTTRFTNLTVVLPPPDARKDAVVEVGFLRTPAGYQPKRRADAALASPRVAYAPGSTRTRSSAARSSESRSSSSSSVHSAQPTRHRSVFPRIAFRKRASAPLASQLAMGGTAGASPRRSSVLERLRRALVATSKPPNGEAMPRLPRSAAAMGPPPESARRETARIFAAMHM
ncbi:hypothetical protein KFE25_011207 [Diacronema lutheri]|uniref:Uncharacterized protein n=1 Tax=Diacronema lutheri TaxID=2081491 RepID=A0A8J5XPS0_DIALT|nr:hypothetical protein KFE25_011207 [Diacronema lutheri]